MLHVACCGVACRAINVACCGVAYRAMNVACCMMSDECCMLHVER